VQPVEPVAGIPHGGFYEGGQVQVAISFKACPYPPPGASIRDGLGKYRRQSGNYRSRDVCGSGAEGGRDCRRVGKRSADLHCDWGARGTVFEAGRLRGIEPRRIRNPLTVSIDLLPKPGETQAGEPR
jgi:hypothetical protein